MHAARAQSDPDPLLSSLPTASFNFRRLDGTMSVKARSEAISEFTHLAEINILLVSLKAASLGVNLTCANHVVVSASEPVLCARSRRACAATPIW